MSGRWVLATRGGDGVLALAQALASRGVELVAAEFLREAPVCDDAGRARVGALLGSVALVAFTSPRAPAALRRAAPDLAAKLAALPAAAVGPASASAARREGFDVVLVGDRGGEALAHALAGRVRPGELVLHPCGRERRDEFGGALSATGVRVLPFVVYAMDATAPAELPHLPAEPPAAVVLTSPRSVRAYLAACGERWLGVPHLAIGATTAAAAAAAGARTVTAHNPNIESIVEELCQICS